MNVELYVHVMYQTFTIDMLEAWVQWKESSCTNSDLNLNYMIVYTHTHTHT